VTTVIASTSAAPNCTVLRAFCTLHVVCCCVRWFAFL